MSRSRRRGETIVISEDEDGRATLFKFEFCKKKSRGRGNNKTLPISLTPQSRRSHVPEQEKTSKRKLTSRRQTFAAKSLFVDSSDDEETPQKKSKYKVSPSKSTNDVKEKEPEPILFSESDDDDTPPQRSKSKARSINKAKKAIVLPHYSASGPDDDDTHPEMSNAQEHEKDVPIPAKKPERSMDLGLKQAIVRLTRIKEPLTGRVQAIVNESCENKENCYETTGTGSSTSEGNRARETPVYEEVTALNRSKPVEAEAPRNGRTEEIELGDSMENTTLADGTDEEDHEDVATSDEDLINIVVNGSIESSTLVNFQNHLKIKRSCLTHGVSYIEPANYRNGNGGFEEYTGVRVQDTDALDGHVVGYMQIEPYTVRPLDPEETKMIFWILNAKVTVRSCDGNSKDPKTGVYYMAGKELFRGSTFVVPAGAFFTVENSTATEVLLGYVKFGEPDVADSADEQV